MIFRACAIFTVLLFFSHLSRAEPCAPQDNAALAYWPVHAELEKDLWISLAGATHTATIDNINDLPIWDELRRASADSPTLPYWVDRAAARPCCDFGLDKLNGPLGFDIRIVFGPLNNLAYLDALRRASELDAEGVANSLVTLLRLARHVNSEPGLDASLTRGWILSRAAQLARLDEVRDLLAQADLTILSQEIDAIPVEDPAMIEAGIRGTASQLAAFLRHRFADPFTHDSIDELAKLTYGISEGPELDAYIAAAERGTLLPEIEQYERWMNECADAVARSDADAIDRLNDERHELEYGPVTCVFGVMPSSIIRYRDSVRDTDLPTLRAIIEPHPKDE